MHRLLFSATALFFGFLSASALNSETTLPYALYPSPEICAELSKEIRLEFYGVKFGSWADNYSNYITMKDQQGKEYPVRASYSSPITHQSTGITINFKKEEWDPGKYTLEIKEGIYRYSNSENGPEIPSQRIEVEYNIGNWVATNDLSIFDTSTLIYLPYDAEKGDGVPYITYNGTTIATYTDYRTPTTNYSQKYLYFNTDITKYNSGWYKLILPENTFIWTVTDRDTWEDKIEGNPYTEITVKAIPPLDGLISVPANGSILENPGIINVWLPNLTHGINSFETKDIEFYENGTRLNPALYMSWYDQYNFGFNMWHTPGKYKVIIPANSVKIDIGVPMPEEIILEYEIIEEDKSEIDIVESDIIEISEMYDLTGKKVIGNAPAGIYIVRKGQEYSKIVIK